MPKHDNNFTPTEVATLIKNLKRKFDVVAENIIPIREDIADLKEDMGEVKIRLTSLEDVVLTAIPSLASRVSVLEKKVE